MRPHRELLYGYLHLISKYKFKVIVSMILLIISAACISYAPKIAGQTINFFLDGLDRTNYESVFYNILILIGLYLAGQLLKLPSSRIMMFIGEKITYKLRLELYNNLTNAQLENVYGTTSGDIMSRINNDMMNVRSFIIAHMSENIATVVTIILTVIMIITTDLKIGLFYLCLLPIYIIILYHFDCKSRPKYKKHQNKMGTMIGYIGGSISNHTAIQAYECQDYVEENYEKINYDLDKYYKSSRLYTGAIPPIAKFLLNLGNIGVYLYGAYLMVNNEILLGSLLTIILYGQILTKPLLKASANLTSLETSVASLDRVLDILQAPSNKPERTIKIDKNDIKGNIEFKNVSYGNIINNFNFKVNPGEVISVTGQDLSKNIIMQLLIGIYKINSGEIILDEYNIYQIEPVSYKNILGVVPGERWIFEGTIAENIGYGLNEYTLDDVKKVYELIGFDEIIEAMPDKYETEISDEKNTISNGEKELICIARAIIRDPKILILEDVTVDITDMIDEMTVFVITEDETIINMSDKVINLDSNQ